MKDPDFKEHPEWTDEDRGERPLPPGVAIWWGLAAMVLLSLLLFGL